MQLRILYSVAASLALVLRPLRAQTPAANANDQQAQDLLRRAAFPPRSTATKVSPATEAATTTNAAAASVGYLTRAELDQQYLEGRLTAKQFQKTLEAWLKDEPKRTAAAAEKQRKDAAQRLQQTSKASPGVVKSQPPRAASPKDGVSVPAPVVNSPPVTPPPGEPSPQQAKISEVEARIDEMLRQKEAREKAALTNAAAATNNVPAGPQTKRQRMDVLLRQFVEGTLSEAEYNTRRAKILAEPD